MHKASVDNDQLLQFVTLFSLWIWTQACQVTENAVKSGSAFTAFILLFPSCLIGSYNVSLIYLVAG